MYHSVSVYSSHFRAMDAILPLKGLSLPWPLTACLIYYAGALLTVNILRRTIDKYVRHNSLLHTFLIEFIGVTQLCACAYENGVIVMHYGKWGFLAVVFCLMLISGMTNPGQFASPLRPLELLICDKIPLNKAAAVFLAQACGCVSGGSIAMGVWYYSREFVAEHGWLYENLPCHFAYKVPFIYVFLNEIAACFIIRASFIFLPQKFMRFAVPALIASLLTSSLSFIGAPGINPIVVSSRMYGCSGLSTSWFFVIYWCCPVIGWWTATWLEPRRGPSYTAPSTLKTAKAKKIKHKKH